MKAGKITAKLRDAVPVCFMVDGKEVKRYKNIDLPDELKELEIKDFKFHIPQDEKILFHLIFDKGVLPEVLPAERQKMTRAAKAAATTQAEVKPVTGETKPIVPATTSKAGTTPEPKPAATATKPEAKAIAPAATPVPEKAAAKEAKPEAAKTTSAKDTKPITPAAKAEAEKPAAKASKPEEPTKDAKPDAPAKEAAKK